MSKETIISSKKPDNKQNKKPEPVTVWNNKTEESYIEQGFDIEQCPHHVFESNSEEKRFLSQVDIRKGPIEKTVWMMTRLKAIDYSDPKLRRKEYVYYHEQWEGKNWLGLKIAPATAHVEGTWKESLIEPELDERTGEILEYRFGGFRQRYDIPWSKKNIDEIIAKSVHSDKDNGIKYVIKFESADFPGQRGPSMHSSFTYEQFAEWSWDEVFKFNAKPKEKTWDFSKASIQSGNDTMNAHVT